MKIEFKDSAFGSFIHRDLENLPGRAIQKDIKNLELHFDPAPGPTYTGIFYPLGFIGPLPMDCWPILMGDKLVGHAGIKGFDTQEV